MREAVQCQFESDRGHMQKSENKIKPMYFWSDGYEEYGILRPDHKKIKEEELAAAVDDKEDEFLFQSTAKKKKKWTTFTEFKIKEEDYLISAELFCWL